MHWLSIVGIGLIVAGTFLTYLGGGLKQRTAKETSSELADGVETIREEYRVLMEQSKLLEQENDRILAENAALSLKLDRSEQDVEVYQFRSAELQEKIDAAKKAQENGFIITQSPSTS